MQNIEKYPKKFKNDNFVTKKDKQN